MKVRRAIAGSIHGVRKFLVENPLEFLPLRRHLPHAFALGQRAREQRNEKRQQLFTFRAELRHQALAEDVLARCGTDQRAHDRLPDQQRGLLLTRVGHAHQRPNARRACRI